MSRAQCSGEVAESGRDDCHMVAAGSPFDGIEFALQRLEKRLPRRDDAAAQNHNFGIQNIDDSDAIAQAKARIECNQTACASGSPFSLAATSALVEEKCPFERVFIEWSPIKSSMEPGVPTMSGAPFKSRQMWPKCPARPM